MNALKNFVSRIATVVLLGLASGNAMGQATEVAESSVPSVGRLLFGLIVVLGLLFLCAYVLKRGGLTGQSGVIKVIAQCAVGTRERVVVIQVGEQQIVIGVTPQQISLLHHLDQPIPSPAATTPSKFAEQLSQLMKGQRPS